MGFATSSDTIVVFAYWVGVATMALTVLLLLTIIAMRLMLNARQARHQRVVARWQPLLMQSVYRIPLSLHPLPSKELHSFLQVWTHYQESLRGDAKHNLNEVARVLRIDETIAALLRKAPFRDRLQAIVAAGHLRERGNIEQLNALLDHGSPVLSLAAARALLQIDARHNIERVIDRVVSRNDWPSAQVATMLKEAGSEAISQPLAEATLRASNALAPKLIRFLNLISPKESGPVLRSLIMRGEEDHVTSTCLQVLNDPAELELVRSLTQHPRWHVRVHAASALGRIGGQQDATILERMLSDEQWWVRYRAAQALAALPFMDRPQLEAMRARQSDRYASDMLVQILAEQGARQR